MLPTLPIHKSFDVFSRFAFLRILFASHDCKALIMWLPAAAEVVVCAGSPAWVPKASVTAKGILATLYCVQVVLPKALIVSVRRPSRS